MLKPGERRLVRHPENNRLLGQVRRTLGGFWRAEGYNRGVGVGPIWSEIQAEWYVLEIWRWSARRGMAS